MTDGTGIKNNIKGIRKYWILGYFFLLFSVVFTMLIWGLKASSQVNDQPLDLPEGFVDPAALQNSLGAESPAVPKDNFPASENYKLPEIRFGGDVTVFSMDNQNLPLSVSNIRSESFINSKGTEAKMVVSWTTNKLARSEIEYSKNDGGISKKLDEDNFSFDHSVVLSNLDQSAVYMFRIKSRDQWGNETLSGYYAVYSGSKPVSVFELIAKAMDDIFGWATANKS